MYIVAFLAVLGWFVFWASIITVAIHFVSKFW